MDYKNNPIHYEGVTGAQYILTGKRGWYGKIPKVIHTNSAYLFINWCDPWRCHWYGPYACRAVPFRAYPA
ncbi:MAG: hypothetical protein HOD16_01980 [Nitrospina sp.]|nr:hypothetical protein [Nitrospina sp.]